MQETLIVDDEGAKKLHREFFQGRTEEETLAQMEERLIELQRKGHTLVRRVPKIGRNQPCPCGSGRKFKKCCIGRVRG